MVSRILVAGDTHGNLSEIERLLALALEQDCDIVWVCGDFGIWPGGNGFNFRFHTNRLAEECGIDVYFNDGNHEDFDLLWSIDDFDSEGFRIVDEHIKHAPRGHSWEWSGRKLGALGGAVSIDKEWRVPGKSWWPQESITDEDVAKALKLPPRLDVLFTHDALVNAPFKSRMKPDIDSLVNRQKVTHVVQNVAPKMMFHGHFHEEYHYWYPYDSVGSRITEVFGLECDGMRRNWVVLDLDSMKVETRDGDGNG